MWSAGRAHTGCDHHPHARRPRAGVSAHLTGAICALSLLCLMLAGCATNLTLPVALANTPTQGITIPADIRHGDQGSILVVVEALIQGKGPYPMALDTGASITLIDRQLAIRLGLADSGPAEQITGIGGAERIIPVKVTQWSLGKAQLPAMTVASASLTQLKRSAGVDGLLGSDVLDRFGAITIDYADSQVTLYQINPGAPTSFRLPESA